MNELLSSIAGDVIGSVFEWDRIKTTEFELFSDQSCFTDDTVMTIAEADAILKNKSYVDSLKYWGRKYPNSGMAGILGNGCSQKKQNLIIVSGMNLL